MNAAQNPTQIYAATLAALGQGDLVRPVEDLRAASVDFVEQVPQISATLEPVERIAQMRPLLEGFLARTLPLADHGGALGLSEAVATVGTIASEIGAQRGPQADPLLALALHDAVWVLAAHSLIHDRTGPLIPLGTVLIPSLYPGAETYVFDSADIRHPDAYERKADAVYLGLREWFGSSELRQAIPRWRRDSDLDASLSEAELLAALRYAQAQGDRTYSHVIGAGGVAERRVRVHFATVSGRRDFAVLLDIPEGDLATSINALYVLLVGPDNWPTREPLIAATE